MLLNLTIVEVLYSSQHYSHVQPIESVCVGWQYLTEIIFKDALEYLKCGFHVLQSHIVQGCINRANRKLRELYQQLTKLEDVDKSVDDEMASEEEVNEDDSDSYESD